MFEIFVRERLEIKKKLSQIRHETFLANEIFRCVTEAKGYFLVHFNNKNKIKK